MRTRKRIPRDVVEDLHRNAIHYFARELCRAVLPDIEAPCKHHEKHTVSIDVTMGEHRYTVKVSRQ